MTGARGVARVRVTLPRGRHGGHPFPAADEDMFTLAVRAAGAVEEPAGGEGPTPYGRLHLVGEFRAEGDWQFAAALAIPELPIVHYPATAAGVAQALVAMRSGSGSPELLLTVDTPREGVEASEVAAAAAVVADRSEELLESLASVEAPTAASGGGRPSTESVERLLEAHSESSAVAFRLYGDVPPGISAVIGRRLEGPTVIVDRAGSGPDDGHPTGVFRVAARLAERLRTGESGWAAVVDARRVAAFRVRPGAGWSVEPPSAEPSEAIEAAPSALLSAVSEGAYVPRPTYVGNISARWRLVAARCANCGTSTFPPRGSCRSCGATERLEPTPLPRRDARVVAVTTVHPGAHPTEFDPLVTARGAYTVALVEPVPGVRITTQLAGPPGVRVAIGDLVDLELRRLYPMEGEWRYGLKAVVRPPHRERTPTAATPTPSAK
ncbi:MAG TPA: zinc ribbon domain-containing protein [Thermoplasmata archaeon]|nr:zinc ribbon domain-containing protein [Thermoplasmata archaeon]